LGIPGSSYALEIAKRYDLSDNVINYAKKNVGEHREKLEDLIVDLQKKIYNYDELINTATDREKNIKKKESEIAKHKKEIDKKFKRAEKDAITHANTLISEMQSKLEKTIKHIIENSASKESIKEAKASFKKVKNKVLKKEQKIESKKRTQFSWSEINVGKKVHIASLDSNGIILEINRKSKKIWVDVNGSRMRLNLDWLSPAVEQKQQFRTSVQKSAESVPFRIDLRGKRGNEALAEVEKFIDNAVVHGLSNVEILHGKGFGILKQLISEFLNNDIRVESFKEAPIKSGGSGVTWVELVK